jgi:TRAP-type mannitol/chloroaromatic compound transport system permease small subunit
MQQDLNINTEIQKELEELHKKIDAIYTSVEKTRKYFFWTMIITIILFVLPLIGLVFVIPNFIQTYTQQIQGI